MPIKAEDYNKVCVVSVDGDLTADNCVAVHKIVDAAVDSRSIADFIVDLEKCPFLDSEGLETLLWVKRRSDDLFGQMKLAGTDNDCRKILEITRLEHRFDCQPTLESALKTIR